MRHRRIGTWLCGILLFISRPALAAPCTTAPDCSEWVTVSSGSVRVLVYRSFPLESRNLDVTRAVVVVHGAGRDADNYFRHVLAALFSGVRWRIRSSSRQGLPRITAMGVPTR